MRDISLHLLDIAENSVRAGATLVKINITENSLMNFSIHDNGKGMDPDEVNLALDPFYTTKKERKKKIGLGLPLLKQNVESSGGKFCISSVKNSGTKIEWTMDINNIDVLPMGNLVQTFWVLIVFYPKTEFFITHKKNNEEIVISSLELRAIFEDRSLSEPGIAGIVKQYIVELEETLLGGNP